MIKIGSVEIVKKEGRWGGGGGFEEDMGVGMWGWIFGRGVGRGGEGERWGRLKLR